MFLDPRHSISVPKITELQRHAQASTAQGGDNVLQIVPLLGRHAHLFVLNLRLHLQPTFLDEFDNFLANFLVDPVFAPRFQWWLFGIGLLAGTFEEIGWTGFATPRLLTRKSLTVAGLTLGLTWALWHLLVDFRYNAAAMGSIWPLEFVITYLLTLTPYRLLLMWVYHRTQSLMLAINMHASFTGSLLVLVPVVPASHSFYWQAIFAIVLWGLVALALRKDKASNAGRRARRKEFQP